MQRNLPSTFRSGTGTSQVSVPFLLGSSVCPPLLPPSLLSPGYGVRLASPDVTAQLSLLAENNSVCVNPL